MNVKKLSQLCASLKRLMNASLLLQERSLQNASLQHHYARRYRIRRSEQPTRSLCVSLRDILRRHHCEVGAQTISLANPRNRCLRIGSSFTNHV